MVSELIAWEGSALLTALFWGMILAAEYDCIRIFRRIVRHRKVWTISVEDILFWINAGITVFCVIYEVNSGVVRGFSLMGFVIGALLYRAAFGVYIVRYATKIILFFLKPLKKLWNLFKIKICRRIKTALKKYCSRKKEKAAQHRKEAAQRRKEAAQRRREKAAEKNKKQQKKQQKKRD